MDKPPGCILTKQKKIDIIYIEPQGGISLGFTLPVNNTGLFPQRKAGFFLSQNPQKQKNGVVA